MNEITGCWIDECDQIKRLEDAFRARNLWKQYYRSVRILRRIRRHSPALFRQFSYEWWNSQYKHESPTITDGLFYGARRVRKLP